MRSLSCILLMAACAFAAKKQTVEPHFQTSERCVACHNELTTPSGQDVSIGFNWRASLMANSSRDPYWQASSRRETLDHPQLVSHIEDECSICHMPITRFDAKLKEKDGQIFAHLPFDEDKKHGKEAADGVDCSVCHQISAAKLGTKDSFNGGFVIEPSKSPDTHAEYGPFQIDAGQSRIMQTSTAGFQPIETNDHIRKSELCATCHTLYTTAFGRDGKAIGSLPEQMPYLEWLNSDFKTKKTCQDCHMPTEPEPVAITRVFGVPREGMKKHVFVAGNFFIQRMLNRYRDDLEVEALPQELAAAADNTIAYLKDQAARVTIQNLSVKAGLVQAEVLVENLGGHKLPTAFPSRRSWLHFVVRDRDGRILFESGAIRPDGSIAGNDNDSDPHKFEPHYTEITNSEQVQIYEDILGDPEGKVTTGLLAGVRYLKDNRLLPHGFNKNTADKDIAVIGEAASDPNFTDAGNRVRYSVQIGDAPGPIKVDAELWYQPIGFRWANNLKPYSASPEPRRFNTYYDAMAQGSAQVLTQASATH